MTLSRIHTISAGVLFVIILMVPVSAASCGCSSPQVVKGPTIWDKGVQWASVTPDTSTLAGTMTTASQGLSQYKALSGGTIGSTLAFKVSSVTPGYAGSRSTGFLPFKKVVK